MNINNEYNYQNYYFKNDYLNKECDTCKNRKYQDGSNEGNVSFKSPGHIDPGASASVVRSHELEHVANARREGTEKNKELVSAIVTLKTATCPECGRNYVSGGQTNTTIKTTYNSNGQNNKNQSNGQNIDLIL